MNPFFFQCTLYLTPENIRKPCNISLLPEIIRKPKAFLFFFFFFAEKIKEDEVAHQHNQSIDIREKNGRITCQFRGDGTYTVSWNRADNQKLRDGIREEKTALIINNVSFNDSGTYKCTAVGPKNTATAEVFLHVYGELFYSNYVYFRLVNPSTPGVHQMVIYT